MCSKNGNTRYFTSADYIRNYFENFICITYLIYVTNTIERSLLHLTDKETEAYES